MEIRKTNNKSKPTIGVLVDSIRYAYAYKLMTGVQSEINKQEYNVLYFNGRLFNSMQVSNESYDVICKLINSQILDYLIIFPGLFYYISREQAADILEKWDYLPIILISYQLEGYSSVLLDNRTGLQQLIEHIIDVHGRKKLACIRAVKGIYDADERFDVFQKVLSSRGIPLRPELILENSRFLYEDGKQLVKMLMDEQKLKPGLDFDAIIGVNDVSLIGAYDALIKRGVNIPGQVSLGGFDDYIQGRYLQVRFSTVRQPIEKLGSEAVKCITRLGSAPRIRYIPTETVIRESCGCTTGYLSVPGEISNQLQTVSSGQIIDAIRPFPIKKIIDAVCFGLKEETGKILVQKLIAAFTGLVKNKNSESFLNDFISILSEVEELNEDLSLWHSALEILTTHCLTTFKEAGLNTRLDQYILLCLARAHHLIGIMSKMVIAIEKDAFDSYLVRARNVEKTIQVILEEDQLGSVIADGLLKLGFTTFYLFLYQDPGDYAHDFKLILSCKNSVKKELDETNCNYGNFNTIYLQLIAADNPFSFMILPVIYKETAFGFLIIQKSKSELAHYVYEDITSQIGSTLQNLKMRARAEAASRSKSEFLANMSHEIRTPLNSILGFADLLLEQEHDPDIIDKLKTINQAGVNLLNIINDILDFSKIEANKMVFKKADFFTTTFFNQLKSMFFFKEKESRLYFTLAISDSVPLYLRGDEQKIRQVLINLLANAFKFTEKGGVTMEASYRHGILTIVVSDTGIGIPEGQLESIFSPFSQIDSSSTRKHGGTGLGLPITKKVVEQMGGKISVSSKTGRGTSFTVDLPLEESGGSAVEKAKSIIAVSEPAVFINETLAPEGRSFTILVAEDDAMNRKLYTGIFSDLHLTYQFAVNGKKTLDLLKKKHFELLLLDMHMPVMDGLQTLRLIRADAELKNMYVLAVTAYALKGDYEKFSQAGCDDYLPKPINKKILLEKIAERIRLKYEGSDGEKEDQQTLQAQEVPVTLDDAAQEKLLEITAGLKRCLKIFSEKKIKILADELAALSTDGYFSSARERLYRAAENYQSSRLNEVIIELEKLGEKY